MSAYAHIKRCLELADRDIASAVADRRMAKALLDQLAKVSRPGDGAPKLLLVFARLAGAEVDWIDGALRVEMVGDVDVTVVEVLSELGLGMHERVFPSFKMSVPLEEFARAVERVPHMVAPLAIASSTGRRLVLTAASEEEEEEGAAGAVSIDDESLYVRRGSKDKLAAVEDPSPHPHSQARGSGSGKAGPAIRKAGEAAAAGTGSAPKIAPKTMRPAAPAPEEPAKAARPQAVPKAPALPRTEEHTPIPPPPAPARSVVAKVPLARIQVPRSAAVVEKRSSKHPKRLSLKPPKGASAPPERRSKAPPKRSVPPKASVPPKRSIPPKASVAPKAAKKSIAPKGRSRAPSFSEPPDQEGIDSGWDDSDET